MSSIMTCPRPALSLARAAAAAAALFGVDAAADAVDLGSERDQAFLIVDGNGKGVAVLKVSNAAEDTETLDMEALPRKEYITHRK